MASDAFPMTEEFGGAVYAFPFAMKPYREGEDFELTGADLEDAQKEGDCEYAVDIARKMELAQIELSKAAFMAWIKKAVAGQAADIPEDQRDAWKTGCQNFAQAMVKKISKLTFYTGNSANMQGSIAICDWNDDGMTGTMYLFKYMLKTVKY